jgi:hypothetical protein
VFNGSFLYSGVSDLQIESRLNLFLILLHACRHIDSILQFRALAPPLSKVKSTQTESSSAQVRLSESKSLQLFLSPTHYVTPEVNSCLYYLRKSTGMHHREGNHVLSLATIPHAGPVLSK